MGWRGRRGGLRKGEVSFVPKAVLTRVPLTTDDLALRRLAVRGCSAVRCDVDARRKLIIAEARFEDSLFVCGGGVCVTADAVVDVFAHPPSILPARVAGLEAEDVGAHKVVPLRTPRKVSA